ncbi:MAG: hypothetical protein C0404_10685, partial [Verrucomicrobia bacterium]|nr:hypothetical protein [Verrucomicrobiota bacterium]
MDGTDQLNDDALLKRFVEQGDREALGALFSRYVNAAYATAMRVCRNSADAEDAVQTAFLQVTNCAGSYRGQSEHGVRAWLMMIVVNSCKKAIRGEVRRRNREEAASVGQDDIFEGEDPGGVDADLREHAREIMEELDRLPEQYRAAIWLRHYEGMSERAASEALGLSEKNLNNRVFRGMSRLRERLAARGTSATIASLAVAIPAISLENAPAALVSTIAGIATGTIKASGVVAAGAGGAWSVVLKTAAAVALAGGVVFIVWKNAGEKDRAGIEPVVPVALPSAG